MFKGISVAYEVRTDEKKRKAYAELGEGSLHSGSDADRARAYRDAARSGPVWDEQRGDGAAGPAGAGFDVDFDLGDLFGFGGGRPRAGPMRGEDVVSRVELDLPQALRGVELAVDVP